MVQEFDIDTSKDERKAEERNWLAHSELPELAEGLDGYSFLDYSEKVEDELTRSQEDPEQEYGLPKLDNPQEFPIHTLSGLLGELYPEYFIAAEGADEEDIREGQYAAAIEPDYKTILLRDESISSHVRTFAEWWEDNTYLNEVPEVTIIHH